MDAVGVGAADVDAAGVDCATVAVPLPPVLPAAARPWNAHSLVAASLRSTWIGMRACMQGGRKVVLSIVLLVMIKAAAGMKRVSCRTIVKGLHVGP